MQKYKRQTERQVILNRLLELKHKLDDDDDSEEMLRKELKRMKELRKQRSKGFYNKHMLDDL